jgi:CBS domain containing-hemolysin-like protein
MLDLLPLVVIALLLVLSFVFSGSEVSLLSISDVDQFKLSRERKKKVQLLHHYLHLPQKALITILIGNMVVNTGASIVGEQFTRTVFASDQLFYSVIIMMFLILLFGEILPKNIAAMKPVLFSRTFIPVIHVTNRIFFPIIFLVQRLVKRSSGFRRKYHLSKDELLSAVESGSEAGVPDTSLAVLKNMIHLINKPISDIMIPRSDLKGVELNDYWSNMERAMKESTVSTLLFYEDSIDHVLGYLKVTDFIHLKKKNIRDTLRKPLYIPETKHVLPLLSEFKASGNYLAIVLDEFGGTAGLVTLRDILDAIFIRDILLSRYIKSTGENSWTVNGSTKISDVNVAFDLNLPVEYNTVGGYIANILGRIPESGVRVPVGEEYTVRIIRSAQRQIELMEFEKRVH